MSQITSCPRRKYDMPIPQRWIRSYFFLVLIPSWYSIPSWYTNIYYQKQKIFRKTIARMRYEETVLGKTLILVAVSELKAQLLFHAIISRVKKLEWSADLSESSSTKILQSYISYHSQVICRSMQTHVSWKTALPYSTVFSADWH